MLKILGIKRRTCLRTMNIEKAPGAGGAEENSLLCKKDRLDGQIRCINMSFSLCK